MSHPISPLIDSHCHLNLSEFNEDRRQVIMGAKKNGVKKILVPGFDETSSKISIQLAKEYPNFIYSSVGFHPYEASHDISPKFIEKIVSDNASENIVAIGECGLDFHLFGDTPVAGRISQQKLLFETQCYLANQYHLPIIIHCRNAFTELFSVLDNLPTIPSGVIHCFTGGLQDLSMALQRGFYIGIDGNVTFSKTISRVIAYIPLNRLLIETDSPYLTPVPFRGKRNEPKNVYYVAKKIAELAHVSFDTICETSSKNAYDLFLFENKK